MIDTPRISILLPTRKRVLALDRSLESLLDTAHAPHEIEFLIGVDQDDNETAEWFDTVAPRFFGARGSPYTAWQFERLGYHRLNEYVNVLAQKAIGHWLLMWNDDAIMDTKGWDDIVADYNDQFAVLRADTNHQHPYAIFPIIPRKWVEITGTFSPHQLNDAWVSQMGYLMDIVIDIPVFITHDRFDLTGNNDDEIYQNRPMLEGNPNHPLDFNHASWRNRRVQECQAIVDYLESQGHNMERWHQVLERKADPWEKMMAKDVKGLMRSIPVMSNRPV